MRPTIWLCAFVLCAGAAQANVRPADQRPVSVRNDSTEIAGSVQLQERPLQGSVMPKPDFSRPLLGPHGGVVAKEESRTTAG